MSYIKKTLTDDEKILLLQSYHYIFWLFPAMICAVCVAVGIMGWCYGIPSFVNIFFILIGLLILLRYLIKNISTENAATTKRVIFKTGFVRTDTDELRNEKIENIQIKQSILGRILNYGDLEFKGTGGTSVIFKLIANPIDTKKKIENLIFEK